MITQTISHYRILNRLGRGGMGEVYLAYDAKLDRNVAIKLLSNKLLGDEYSKKRLIREARAAAKLDHPNICTVYEVGEENDASFIVMQYVEGETLADRLRSAPLTLREALDVAIEVAEALAEAHSHNIIHRDIKPQNIMITVRGLVKVLDFGLAKSVREESLQRDEADTETALTSPGLVIGTLPYMSPEQVRGEALDVRSDIFSLGVMLYELVTGRHPFRNPSVAATIASILTQDPIPLIQFIKGAPIELQRLITKVLSKDRLERYQSVADLLKDLQSLRRETAQGIPTLLQTPGKQTAEGTLAFSNPIHSGNDTVVAPPGVGESGISSARRLSTTVLRALLATIFLVGVAGAAFLLWPKDASKQGYSTQRHLSYSVTVLREGEAFQHPASNLNELVFENTDQIRLNVTTQQAGFLYILNQAPYLINDLPTYILQFPRQESAPVAPNQEIRVPERGWMIFGQEKGVEKIWLIWSAESLRRQ